MGSRKQPKMPPDDQMLADQDAIRAIGKVATAMRKHYPQNPDLQFIERCAAEFRPAQEWDPKPGQPAVARPPRKSRAGLPPRETLADRTVEKGTVANG